MAQIDTYRNTLSRKQQELVKLKQDLAREQCKLSPLQRKIISVNDAIRRTKIASTVKSKLREIEQANKSIADIQKKCGNIQDKIAKKEKEVANAENDCRKEEARLSKKAAEAERKRVQEAARQSAAFEASLRQQGETQLKMQMEIEKLKAIPEKITVLFLAANPIDTQPLRLDEEARAIQKRIRLSEYRDSVVFESRWATRSSDILQAINETNPTIVHFSGHGTPSGDLVLLNPDGTKRIVRKEAISMAISTASDSIKLVVFNACFSEVQAQSVVSYVDAAIGMSTSIGDEAACVFASQLYSAIGFGHSLQTSFRQAIAQLMLEDIDEENTPKLYVKDGLDSDNIVFVHP